RYPSIGGSARQRYPSASGLGPRSIISPLMPPENALATTFTERDWAEAHAELAAAQQAVAAAPAGIARQAPFDRALASERRCTEIIHDWLAGSLEMDRVGQPRMLLSLDVDGVLEDWSEGFT